MNNGHFGVRFLTTRDRAQVCSFFIALLLAGVLAAQQANVPVTIQISDPSGTGIPNAEIQLSTLSGAAISSGKSDAQGHFSANLQVGKYELAVSAAGFKNASQHIEVGAGEPRAGQVISVILQLANSGSPQVVPSDSLVLGGGPYHADIALSTADFSVLPHVSVSAHNSHTNASENYSGVSLAALLAKINAPMGKDLRGDAMKTYVVATGSDGYAVVLSLAEVDPSFHENQIIVADSRDGQPIGKNGPFQLIVPGDSRPARWVHNLVSIRLQRAQ
jgi:hypothetical protein